MENKKDILFICNGDHPATQGGVQTFGRVLNRIFSDRIVFLSYKTPRKKIFNIEGVIEVYSSNFFFRVFNKILKNKIRNFFMKKNIEKLNPNICILRTPTDIKVLEKINCKKILVQHINYKIYTKEDFKIKGIVEKIKRELDYFVFLSPFDREKFIKELKFPKEKAIVIRHSCELEILSKAKIKNKRLIMICRLNNKHKRIDLAIKSMKKLQDYTLEIYGDGSDRKYLENLIKKENLSNVFLCGGTNQIKEKLDNNSIFIMTSDFEGYGITNIEAMRRGLPIILRNTFEAAPDIINNNGILLEKEWNEDKFVEAVNKIYDNYEFYSKNSIEMGKRHDFEIIKKQWEKLFLTLE